MPEMEIDEFDARILQALQRNARLSNVELAKKIGLSPSPCLARVRALHQAGVIKSHVTILNAERLGWRLTAFVHVTLDDHSAARLKAFDKMASDCPNVMECYLMASDATYLLRVVGKDVRELRDFIVDTLMQMDGVVGYRSSVVLDEIKRETAYPVVPKARDSN